jgi:hypothetical protein
MAMSCLDRLQQAWQSQPDGTLGINPDQLLKVVRLERRTIFWCDVFVILTFLCVMVFMLWSAFRDIQKDWPWLISAASDAWVVGYILFNRWRRQRDAARYDEPLLAHVEWAIKDIEHRMWLDRDSLWWYVLPIAAGCMIPPVLFFAMEYSKRPLLDSLIPLLLILGVFAAVFTFVHLVMKYGRRMGLETRRQELLALRALRESLLNTEEPRV